MVILHKYVFIITIIIITIIIIIIIIIITIIIIIIIIRYFTMLYDGEFLLRGFYLNKAKLNSLKSPDELDEDEWVNTKLNC